MRPSVQNILSTLNSAGIRGKPGNIVCTIAGFSFTVKENDVVGKILEEWFGCWMTANSISYTKPGTQKWPDYILSNGDHLEVKSFNHNARPAFDIANLKAYTTSLLTHPERLDDDYLIFSYVMNNGVLHIQDYWVKNVWEVCGISQTNHIHIGGSAINIRPIDWRSSTTLTFKSRKDYVTAISKAGQQELQNFNGSQWISNVSNLYQIKTNQSL